MRVLSEDPLLIAHDLDRTPVALTGIDAAALLREQTPSLHQQHASTSR